MAKSRRKSSKKRMGKSLGTHKFAGKTFKCHGKRVKARGGKRTARIFCRAVKSK